MVMLFRYFYQIINTLRPIQHLNFIKEFSFQPQLVQSYTVHGYRHYLQYTYTFYLPFALTNTTGGNLKMQHYYGNFI